MGIVQAPSVLPGQVGVLGALKYMVTTDSLATITTAGYLNAIDLAVNPIFSSDVLGVTYSYNVNTNSGTFEVFTVSISNGVVTLIAWANPGDVLLPVVSGDFANFNGTSGQIKDAGYSATNAAKTKVVMLNAAPTINHVAIFTAADGTIGDGGVLGTAAAKAASNNALSTVASTAGSGFTIGHIVSAADTLGTIQDSGVTVASLSGAITQLGTLQQVSVTFSPAQMVTAFDTPLTIIAAPGASSMIQIISAAVYTASTGHTAYATGTAPIIQYGTTVHGGGTLATGAGLVAGDITAATSQVRTLGPAASTAWTATSNQPITFSNATGDYTGGTGTNVTVTLIYQVLTATV